MDDNTVSLVKPNRILSSLHGTDISLKDNYFFCVKSLLELCVAVLIESTIFCSVIEDLVLRYFALEHKIIFIC